MTCPFHLHQGPESPGNAPAVLSAAMMLDQGFSIHHEAHKGHEERTTGLEKQPDFNILFSSFVLFVSFVWCTSDEVPKA